jgi:hypothetical protein
MCCGAVVKAIRVRSKFRATVTDDLCTSFNVKDTATERNGLDRSAERAHKSIAPMGAGTSIHLRTFPPFNDFLLFFSSSHLLHNARVFVLRCSRRPTGRLGDGAGHWWFFDSM